MIKEAEAKKPKTEAEAPEKDKKVAREPVSMKFLRGTRTWWPSGRHIAASLDLNKEFIQESKEDKFGEALDITLKQMRLWIPDLEEADVDGLTVIQMSCVAGLVIAAAMKSDPGLIVNNCKPQTFHIKIGDTEYAYDAKFGKVRASQERLMTIPYPENLADEWDHVVDNIRVWIPDVKDSDLDMYSLDELRDIYPEIYMTAIMWLEPELKKVLQAAGTKGNRASRRKRTKKKNTTRKDSSRTLKRKEKKTRTSTRSKA